METFFRRYFFIVHLAALSVSATLIAMTINGVVGHFLAGDPQPEVAEASSSSSKRSTTGAMRDFDAAADANIFDGKREPKVIPGAVKAGEDGEGCETDADCGENEKCVAPEGEEEEVPNPAGSLSRRRAKSKKPEETPKKVCVSKGPLGELADAIKSELPITLVGTSVFSYPEDSLASIVDGDGRKAESQLYSINDCERGPEIPADAGPENPVFLEAQPAPCNDLMEGEHTLVRIDLDRIYILNNDENRYEFILLEDKEDPKDKRNRKSKKKKKKDKPKKKGKRGKKDEFIDKLAEGITKTGPNEYSVKQEAVNEALGNLSKLATQARIVPAFESGEPVGFKLFSIRPGSLYGKLGIQNGDIIQSVNGYEITSPDKALELYQKLRDGKSFSVDIKRRGKPITFEYGVSP